MPLLWWLGIHLFSTFKQITTLRQFKPWLFQSSNVFLNVLVFYIFSILYFWFSLMLPFLRGMTQFISASFKHSMRPVCLDSPGQRRRDHLSHKDKKINGSCPNQLRKLADYITLSNFIHFILIISKSKLLQQSSAVPLLRHRKGIYFPQQLSLREGVWQQ